MTVPASEPVLLDFVAHNARTDPAGVALVYQDDRWTHRDLADAVDDMARALLAAGVKHGDRVAALMPPSPCYWITFLATTSIGAIWTGLNPAYQPSELQWPIDDAMPTLLFAADPGDGSNLGDVLAPLCAASSARVVVVAPHARRESCRALDAFLAAGAAVNRATLQAARDAVAPRDPALIVYTSGSTGRPKGALLHQQGMTDFATRQNAMWPVSSFRVLNYFPINHIGCIVDVSVPALVAGGTMIFMNKFDPRTSLALMVRERVTIWGSVPSVFLMQLDVPDFAAFDLSAVELIMWGGAAMDVATIKRLRAIHPRLATNYGMTETSSAITSLAPTNDLDRLAHSVGTAFPDVEIKLVDAEGNGVPDGEVGEVLARSRMNFLGYWRNPAMSNAAFDSDGYFRTGDLARRQDGHFQIVGRVKEMYKSGGYNIYPREIEAAIAAHPAVSACAVVGVADPLWQEIGVAFVVPEGPCSELELIAHCRNLLANYKVPKRFIFCSDLPLLPIGKVDKGELAKRALTS